MSTQLDIVYKLKEVLETANPEVAILFMADDFTHQTPPTQYVSLVYPRTSSETGTYFGRYPTRLGAPRRTRDQYSMEGACRRDQLQTQASQGRNLHFVWFLYTKVHLGDTPVRNS